MSYPKVEAMRQALAKHSSKARLRQGENGCPSEMIDCFALSNNPWTEYSQAKWNMRRMLGDLGHGYESAVYTMSDFRHRGEKIRSPNNKGLVRANANRETIGIKRAYYAVQNVAGLFDAQTVPDASVGFTNTDITVAYTSYRKTAPDGRAYPLVAFWTQGHMAQKEGRVYIKPADLVLDRPGDSFATRPTVFDFPGPALAEPVWVDLLTGRVYALPKDRMLVHSAASRSSTCRSTTRRVSSRNVPRFRLTSKTTNKLAPLREATENAILSEQANLGWNLGRPSRDGQARRGQAFDELNETLPRGVLQLPHNAKLSNESGFP